MEACKDTLGYIIKNLYVLILASQRLSNYFWRDNLVFLQDGKKRRVKT